MVARSINKVTSLAGTRTDLPIFTYETFLLDIQERTVASLIPRAAAVSATVNRFFSFEMFGLWPRVFAGSECELGRCIFVWFTLSSRDCARYSLTSKGTTTLSIHFQRQRSGREPSCFETSSGIIAPQMI
jgi:hypothetical protein